jgi:hypothetical protein
MDSDPATDDVDGHLLVAVDDENNPLFATTTQFGN